MQAGISLLTAAILVIWTAVTFRGPLPRPLPASLGINYNGLSSIAVMPISLFSASVFRWKSLGCHPPQPHVHAAYRYRVLPPTVCMHSMQVMIRHVPAEC
jgi:hypothetical protein